MQEHISDDHGSMPLLLLSGIIAVVLGCLAVQHACLPCAKNAPSKCMRYTRSLELLLHILRALYFSSDCRVYIPPAAVRASVIHWPITDISRILLLIEVLSHVDLELFDFLAFVCCCREECRVHSWIVFRFMVIDENPGRR